MKHNVELGELERQTMETLWNAGPLEAKQVHQRLGKSRGITLNTIQSTLKRLFDKGLLGREKVSHAHIYSPAVSREEFRQSALSSLINDLSGGKFDEALSTFVDLTERAGKDELERLEQLVQQRLKEWESR